MPKWGGQFGAVNGAWKGGRTVASNGYVLIRVGVEHNLADVRGYAYEHRIEAEKMLGRRLQDGEIVHHRDGNKQNNAHENLEVHGSIAEHLNEHRRPASNRRRHGEPNPVIRCECGCGALFMLFDAWGRPRRFVTGHNMLMAG